MPSVTDSPISGISSWTVSPSAAAAPRPPRSAAALRLARLGRVRRHGVVADVGVALAAAFDEVWRLRRVGPRRAVARRGGLTRGVELGERRPDLDRLVLALEDLGQRPARRRRDLGVDLVGRDLDHGLALLDEVPLLLVPFEHGALGHGLAHLGHLDLERRRLRHFLPLTLRNASGPNDRGELGETQGPPRAPAGHGFRRSPAGNQHPLHEARGVRGKHPVLVGVFARKQLRGEHGTHDREAATLACQDRRTRRFGRGLHLAGPIPAMASAVVRYADPNGATATSNCTSSDPTDLTNPPCEIERAVETVSVKRATK